MNARTLELCRRWGIADDLRAASKIPPPQEGLSYVTALHGKDLAYTSDCLTFSREATDEWFAERGQCSKILSIDLNMHHS